MMISKGMIFGLILIISGLSMVIWGFNTFADEGFNYWLQFGLTDLFFGVGIIVMIRFWNRK